jgi:hypothetical protein
MKLFQWIAYFTILAALGLLLLFGYWLLWPYNPVDFKSPIYPILNEGKIATQGGILSYQIDYCKNVSQVPVINKKYVDGIIYETPQGRGVIYQGCRVQQVDNVVPLNLLPGEYFMQVVIDYQVNPIRHIIYNNRTEGFNILPADL